MYDKDIARYEGKGKATLVTGGIADVSFVLRQQGNSDLTGSCELLTDYIAYGDIARLEGTTVDGWSIVASFQSDTNSVHPWHEHYLSPQTITATAPDADHMCLTKAAGPLLNLRLPYPYRWWNPEVPWRGYQLDITPIAEYETCTEHLEDEDGVAQTATISLAPLPNQTPEQIWQTLIGIIYPLSLGTGRLVTLAGMDLLDVKGRPGIRFHADAIRHPYRTHAAGFGLTTNPKKLITAWDTQPSLIVPSNLLISRISQYLDSLTASLYLDSRAILAVCLLDAFSTEYCAARNQGKLSLKERLKFMAKDLHIDIATTPDICEVVKTSRHNLVHEGKFVSAAGGPNRVWETIQTHWLAFAFLSRIVDPQIGIRPIYDVRTQAGTMNTVMDSDL